MNQPKLGLVRARWSSAVSSRFIRGGRKPPTAALERHVQQNGRMRLGNVTTHMLPDRANRARAQSDHADERSLAGKKRLPRSRGAGHTVRMSSTSREPKIGAADIQPGDWIKYRSGYYGSGRLAEVHGLGSDVHSGGYAVTSEGNVLFERIIEVRRRPINVIVFPRGS